MKGCILKYVCTIASMDYTENIVETSKGVVKLKGQMSKLVKIMFILALTSYVEF